MRKYQFRKWPFMVVLFTGLSCPLHLPSLSLQACKPKPANAKVKGGKAVPQINHRQASLCQSESFPFGPQLLLVVR